MPKKESRTPLERKKIIQKTERYVRECMKNLPPNVHDFKHVDRVRKWAIKIARAEKKDLFLAEMAALLHDVGRSQEKPPKILHATIGSKMAYQFLTKNELVSQEEAEQISYAVACHSRGGKGWLVDILQDADKLDGFGAIDLTRIIQDAHSLPEYNLKLKLRTKFPQEYLDKTFKFQKRAGRNILEEINYHISWYDKIHTPTARKFGKPLVQYLKDYQKQFYKELK